MTSPNSNKTYLSLLNTDISSVYNQTTAFSGMYFESQLLFVHTFGPCLVEWIRVLHFRFIYGLKKIFF